MKRILQTTTLALAVAALLVPVAAAERPDDRAGMIGVGGATAVAETIRPDDRAEARGPGALLAVQAAVHPDDRAEPRGPGSLPTVFVAEPATDAFDWGDAGVGAVGAFALALLLLGGLLLTMRGRRDHATA